MLVYNYTADGFIEVEDESGMFILAYLGYDETFGQWELCDIDSSLSAIELEEIAKKLRELNNG